MMYTEGEQSFRECVACDFSEKMQFQNPVRELDTRVNRSEEEKQAETRPVKLVDPD